jgi:serine-type D-Ala-D-Ala carboxypeptidase/endopeptidase (penicillin-binding protein 4)
VRRQITLGILFVLTLLCAGFSWRSATPVDAATSKIEPIVPVIAPQRVPALLAAAVSDSETRSGVASALAGWTPSCLAASRDGRPVVQQQVDKAVTPASTMKLVTASAALDILGPDATFTTTVRSSSKPKNGTLSGPIYLVGGGDPLLFTNDYVSALQRKHDIHTSLEALAQSLVDDGLRQVNGSVVADDSRFDHERAIPSWDSGYQTQAIVGTIGALVVDNGMERFDRVRSVASDPALHASTVFTQILRNKGVTVTGAAASGVTPDKANELATATSRPVREIVAEMLTESDNTTAEILLKDIAVASSKNNRAGTTKDGVAAATASLRQRGVDTNGLVMTDGSGLDRSDRTTCKTLLQVLTSHGPNSPLADGLAHAGETGTLDNRMEGTKAVGTVRAKTGTLSGVSALAGWATPNGQPPVAFVMISNTAGADKAHTPEDRVAIALASLSAAPPDNTYAEGLTAP